jgi:hypothetical protein
MRLRGENLQKRWLERYNHQIGESEITAGCEQRFTPERCERINRAVPEVELGSMTHALSEAPNVAIAAFAWGSSNGTISHPSSSTRRYRAGSDFAPLRARRTIPASSSEANQHPTTRLAQPECNQWTCRSLLDICLAGNSEFVISEDFSLSLRKSRTGIAAIFFWTASTFFQSMGRAGPRSCASRERITASVSVTPFSC